mmetsp:Transcript_9113/g.18227  ORF Transcript_9113/g.18227 Transcript_9113/m.18227 type:complete len:85 (-) Transcript_9113:107-361(-)
MSFITRPESRRTETNETNEDNSEGEDTLIVKGTAVGRKLAGRGDRVRPTELEAVQRAVMRGIDEGEGDEDEDDGALRVIFDRIE